MSSKYSITHKKVAVWHYPVLARALEDIHNDCEGVYPVFNNDSCLTHVEVNLDVMFNGDLSVSGAQVKMFKLLKDTEADPEHTQALREVLNEVMFNDSLEILA